MTEEEKKAIENAKEYVENEEVLSVSTFDIKKLLNLIKKQQKETENLKSKIHSLIDLYKQEKEKNKKQQNEIEQLANGIRILGTNPDITTEEIIKEFTEKPITEEYMEEFKNSYISKDEVLKALGYEENDEEYKRIYNKEELILSLIRTINEECDRLEDIEDQKTMLEIHNIENQRNKYWENKIREIIGWKLVIKDEKSNNYRPIKNTTAQDIYEAFYEIRNLLKEKHND